MTATGHSCPSLADVGHCPICRPRILEYVADGCHGWLLSFFGAPDAGKRTAAGVCNEHGDLVTVGSLEPEAVAVVRTWEPGLGAAAEAAWATGCNPGTVLGDEPVPVEDIERSGVPVFTLLRGLEFVAKARRQLGLDQA